MDFPFDSMFSSGDFSFEGIDQDRFSSTDRSLNNSMENVQFYGAGEYRGNPVGIPSLYPDYGYCPDEYLGEGFIFSKSLLQEQQQQQQSFSVYELFDDIPQYGLVLPPFEACLEDITKPGEIPTVIPAVGAKKDKEYPRSLAALELLNNHGNGFKRLRGERVIQPSNDLTTFNDRQVAADCRTLSTEDILRFAGARFIQSYSQQTASHPFEGSFSGLSQEQTKDVELVELLLASAEKVGGQQYESASRLLNFFDYLAPSSTGNPVQRVVYYFIEALKERIDRETGRNTSKGLGKNLASFDMDKAMMVPDAPKLAFHQGLPFSQVEKFAGIQAIIENVSESNKVHVIDLRIAYGVQWIALMQALASRHEYCPIELFKVTAVATTSKHVMEETGKWLSNFADTLKIPFNFKIVMVSDMFELKEDLFELDEDETIAVYSSYALRGMISQPAQLESLMRVIRSLNPCVMVVTEVDANHNSPVFVNRFIEALFFYGTLFDSLESFMNRDEPNRMAVEGKYCFQAIRNIVATEGEERTIRNVKIDVWRAFFARFGMEELKLSPSSIYQAKLIVKSFPCGDSCTLSMNGKCMMIGWKGTPHTSLSVWKFL
ncbi:GRAS transcription factor [Trema orientale]|uniref:GRAS transcription factor n=1 Tax=Trema orientale TaxID=63057 RepID=A0A2P5F5Z5_TREOI|nr:GRAS transcription factor [Trema orientale]